MSINNTLNKEYLLNNINTILEMNTNYGRSNIGNNKKINIEICNNNSSNQINTSNIKSIIDIDNLSRIMSFCNYNVTKEFYLKYNLDNIDNLINNIKKELDIYRIYFDNYSNSKEIQDNYLVEDTLTKLRYTNNCYIKDNGLALKINENITDNDYILIDNEGKYTDISLDITHILNNNIYDKIIFYTDNKNDNYKKSITKALEFLEGKTPNIEIKDLPNNNSNNIESININLLRYTYASNQDITISSKYLTEIENINIKLNSIIRKNNKNYLKIDKYITLNSDITYTILNTLNEFKNTVIYSCQKQDPSVIVSYLTELTNSFNIFTKTERIITEDDVHNQEIIKFLSAIKIVINNALNLIGIIPRD